MARKRDSKLRNNKQKKYDDSEESDSTLPDNVSVMSNASSDTEQLNGQEKKPDVSDIEESEVEEIDQFETKLDTVLDYIQTTKCAGLRVKHWLSLKQALTTRYCLEYLENRKTTLLEVFERGLKGADDEIEAVAMVIALTLITFGTTDDFAEEVFNKFFVSLNRMLMNPTAKPNARAKCGIALSLGCFITDVGIEKSQELSNQLLSIAFGTVNTKQLEGAALSDYYNLQATCLDMFGFLISIENDSDLEKCLSINLDKLVRCLESPNLTVRIAAGECTALLMEGNESATVNRQALEQLCDQLEQLATDNQKSRSKKDLRVQRSNFRQIMQTVQGDSITPEEIRFGQEKLIIDSWKLKRYYDSFCALIGNGINIHLGQNELLRDIFNLGDVLPDDTIAIKYTKSQKHYIQNINRKNRDMVRNKLRDRRQRMLEG